MDNENIEQIARAIEGILMVAIEPVPVELLAQLFEAPTATIENVIASLELGYVEQGRGFQIVKVAGGYRFQSHPDVSAYVERFVLDGQRARLSAAALETLAIVAYKQPISRLQIASILESIPTPCSGLFKGVVTSNNAVAMTGRVRLCCGEPRRCSSKSWA